MKRLSVLAAVVLVVLLVHAWGGSAVGVSPLSSCEPDCVGVVNGVKVVNPLNCSEYYYCNSGNPIGPVPCDNGTHFDDVTEHRCVVGADCQPACGSGGNCKMTCTENWAAIGDAFNCSVYYVCSPGQAIPQACSNDRRYFDPTTELCVSDDSVCCTGYCEAYCDGSGFSLVPDPNNCTWFYICDTTTPGKPEETHHFQCNDGYFSVQLGDCVSDTPPDPCPTLCGAVSGGSSTTTTTTTTTSSSSTTSTTTTPGGGGSTDINGCLSSLVCTASGNFAACSTCQQEYFICSGAGASGVLKTCTDGYVFNTNTAYPNCVLASHCPFP